MANNVNILENGQGVIYKFTVDTVAGNSALKADDGKKLYIDKLIDNESENVCLIAYCVLNTRAAVIVKGSDRKTLDAYIRRVNRAFYSETAPNGFPFRPIIGTEKVNEKNLLVSINEVHRMSPSGDINYPYCSYNYLADGRTDAVIIIKNVRGDMTLEGFQNAMRENVRMTAKSISEYESPTVVMEQIRRRYLSEGGGISESNVIFALAELCDRTRLPYKRAAAKLGIRGRRDILVGVVCDMVIRRKYSINMTIARMKLKKEYDIGLIIEVIAELNRVYSYSYDYILSVLGIDDSGDNILIALFRGLNDSFGWEFETLCVKFHLQGDLAELRSRCGL